MNAGLLLRIPGAPACKSNSYKIIKIGGFYRLGKSAETEDYEQRVIAAAKTHIALWGGITPIFPAGTELEVVICWHRADKRRKDISNIAKAIEDGLTKAGLWADDSQVATLLLTRVHDVPKGTDEWVDLHVRMIPSMTCSSPTGSRSRKKKQSRSDT